MRKCAPSQGRPSGRVTVEVGLEYPNRHSSAIMPSVNVIIRLAP